MQYTGDPINGFVAQYDSRAGSIAAARPPTRAGPRATAQSGEQSVQSGQAGQPAPAGGHAGRVRVPAGQPDRRCPATPRLGGTTSSSARCSSRRPQTDPTLQNPRCVFQIVRRHFARYTPEMVERVTGCPQETFLQVAETLTANSGPERTSSFCYAIAWTQHTYGVQIIGAAALLQLLLGNMGRPGGGIMALRGHATIQGCTDIPTLYHSIHGYMPAPSALRPHDDLEAYLRAETLPTGATGPTSRSSWSAT